MQGNSNNITIVACRVVYKRNCVTKMFDEQCFSFLHLSLGIGTARGWRFWKDCSLKFTLRFGINVKNKWGILFAIHMYELVSKTTRLFATTAFLSESEVILAREFSHSIKLLVIAVFQRSYFQYPGRNNLTAYKYNIFLVIISIAF